MRLSLHTDRSLAQPAAEAPDRSHPSSSSSQQPHHEPAPAPAPAPAPGSPNETVGSGWATLGALTLNARPSFPLADLSLLNALATGNGNGNGDGSSSSSNASIGSMSTTNADHNYYTLSSRRQTTQPAVFDPSRPSPDYDLDRPAPTADLRSRDIITTTTPLPTYNCHRQPVHAHSPAKPKRPAVSTQFEQYASNASLHGFTSEPPSSEPSPDPYDFYRHYPAPGPYRRPSGGEGLGLATLIPPDDGGMTAVRSSQRATPVTARPYNYAAAPLSTRYNGRSDARSIPSPAADKASIATAKSTPPLPSTHRGRQSSLQALVNRFNQTPDEVPPLPLAKPGTRPVVTTSPTNNHGPRPYQLRQPGVGAATTRMPSTSRHEPTDAALTMSPRRIDGSRGHGGSPGTTRSLYNSPTSGPPTTATNGVVAFSSSTTNLNPARQHSMARKPLFGEVLTVSTAPLDPGYGIADPHARPRRGSEGSMHNPNAMFTEERGHSLSRVSPSSPTAWYLGVTPSLDGIDLDKPIPARPPGLHRRSRSDFAKPPLFSSGGRNITIMSPPLESASPVVSPTTATTATIKRNSQSRIPVSTRRMSANSDSGNSSSTFTPGPSARSPSSYRKAGSKGGGGVKPTRSTFRPPSPERHRRPTPPIKPPKFRNASPAKPAPGASPRLKAYISEPAPTQSPPLRSSRPRQPVSTASTSASRARTVEHHGSTSSRGSSRARDGRAANRNMPELGGVDFAARRQRIQQAFTETVKKNAQRDEIQAEQKRRSLLLPEPAVHHRAVEPAIEIPRASTADDDLLARLDQVTLMESEETLATPVDERARTDLELTIETAHLSDKSVLDLSQEDSPTLGVADRYLDITPARIRHASPASDTEPASAVTVGSTGTFFDHEPQDGTSSPDEHRPSFHRPPEMREPGPADPHDDPDSPLEGRRPMSVTDDSSSERDDRESIQIMLEKTPVTERPQVADRLPDGHTDDGTDTIESRWSVDSWASSQRSQDRRSYDRDLEAPMDRIDEHSPPQSLDVAHVSVSTMASSHEPPLWSPGSTASNRTTMDGDSYATINRVLDSYHHQSSLSPEIINDFQQRILRESPNLIRAGGWDPKKVTQLYLQNLARSKYAQSGARPEPLEFGAASSSSGTADAHRPSLADPDRHDDADEPATSPADEPADDFRPIDDGDDHRSAASERLDVDPIPNPQRASLNQPSDWANTSPSMLDWIHHQAEDTPTDDKPSPMPRKWSRASLEVPGDANGDRPRTARPLMDAHPQLPEIQQTHGGLGIIDINIESPHDRHSPASTSHRALPSELPSSPLRSSAARASFSSSLGHKSHPPSPHAPSRPAPLGVAAHGHGFPPSAAAGRHVDEPAGHSPSLVASADPSLRSVEHSRSQGSAGAVGDAPPKPTSSTAEQKRLNRRRNIIKEIVDTESSFGQDMKIVDDIYKGTSQVIVIAAEDVKVLFGNSDQIVAFSTAFLDSLKLAAKSVYVMPKSKRWKSKRDSAATSNSGNTDDQSSVSAVDLSDDEKDRHTFLGDAFANHLAQMERVYTEYLKNHDAANQKLQQLQKIEKVKVWLEECRRYAHDLTKAWDLDSLLVKPVQRILKYPLLLKELLEVTPENHPDFTALDGAAREVEGISRRINELKRRADLVEAATTTAGKKRKDFDGRIGLPKAFGRRTEKLKQQVGLSDNVKDLQYDAIAEKWGQNFMQVQVVLGDVEFYVKGVEKWTTEFNDFALAIEAYMDVSQQTTYPDLESKWRKYRMSMREIQMTALPDHANAIRKSVIAPIQTLQSLYTGPERFMEKRKKRILDYARYRAIRDRGDKPDKKTTEQGEQYIAINETLKDELPKLYTLTKTLIEAAISNFVQLQIQWHIVWKRKLSQAIDVHGAPVVTQAILESFAGDYQFAEAQLLTLGLVNGSLLADAGANLVHFLSPSTTLNDDAPTSQRPSLTTIDSRTRALSQSSNGSPVPVNVVVNGGRATTDGLGLFGHSSSSTSSSSTPYNPAAYHQHVTGRRVRAGSATSAMASAPLPPPRTPEVAAGGWRTFTSESAPALPPHNTHTPNTHNTHTHRPSTATSQNHDLPSLPRLSVDTPAFNRLSGDSLSQLRTMGSSPSSRHHGGGGGGGAKFTEAWEASSLQSQSQQHRYSGFFSSAMPMSDSPGLQTPVEEGGGMGTGGQGGMMGQRAHVLFTAASVYEFNIDRARKEAGYPYLTYAAGEIFDVIGEKGELWLARNQDDGMGLVGWIWNKHFAKLAAD